MPEAPNQILIFLPVLVLVALTAIGFIRMAAGRAAAVKRGQDPAFYRAHLGGAEPEVATVGARHWDNLFELPTLFYAACLTAFVINGVSVWTLRFAWIFVVARVVQSIVHMTYNAPTHRGSAFAIGVIFVFAMWVNVALSIFAAI